MSITYLFDSRSKIPSHPINKKSKLSLSLNVLISGSQTITFAFPPYRDRLASMSPKVLETDSLPGKTLKGP